MRIGVFGGTFDPVHLGHLILAEQCREQARLDRVLFVPAARPPHKPDGDVTPFERRVEMLEMAIAGNPAFAVDELEKDRPPPSYTADTLEELHRRRPEAELFFLLGSDSLRDLPKWHDPHRVVRAATLLVMLRAEAPIEPMTLASGEVVRVLEVDAPPVVSLSSSDLRRRVAEGRSIRYLVPPAVVAYVEAKGLYRPPLPR